jgi:hypothetical protein
LNYWRDLASETEEGITVKSGKSMIENVKSSCFYHRYQRVYQHAVDWTPVYALEDLSLEGKLKDMYFSFINMDFRNSHIYMEENGTLTSRGMTEKEIEDFLKSYGCMLLKVNESFYC